MQVLKSRPSIERSIEGETNTMMSKVRGRCREVVESCREVVEKLSRKLPRFVGK